MMYPDFASKMAEGEHDAGLGAEYRDTKDFGHSDHSDEHSVVSDDSDISAMEPFDSYKTKIEQLLDTIGFHDISIEALQHGYGFMNCVYALTSLQDPAEQLVLRVAIDGAIRESDGRHETLENDIAVLAYLNDKLPVPRIKAYSVTADNVLGAAYTIQTRVPGEPLSNLWATMDYRDKYALVDEFLDLLCKIESIKFANAGTFADSASLPNKSDDVFETKDPSVHIFKPYSNDQEIDYDMNDNHRGSDLKSFLIWHLQSWIQEEYDRGQYELSCAISPRFKKLLAMLEDMDNEGFFEDQPFPILLHHWDLEPRNLMVSKASGAWKICGIIDWDDALALPRPLSRIPPRWIWHFPDEDPDLEDGYLNDDQYADPELSDENKALKAYFDCKAEVLLPGYAEDAYGRGRWMRRIWHFAKEGAFKTWEWDFLDQLPKDWAARPRPKPKARNGPLYWLRAAVESARSAVLDRLFKAI